MKKGMRNAALVLAALVVGVFLLSQIGMFSASVIALSDVTTRDNGEFILATIVVDQQDISFWTLPVFSEDIGSGKRLFTKTTGVFRFVPLQSTCDYDLEPRSKAIRIAGIPIPGWNVQYYTPLMPDLPNVPFRIDIGRDNILNPTLTKTIDAYTETVSIFDTEFGPVTVTKIGDLSTGYSCPDHQFAIFNNGGNWEVADLAAFERHIEAASDFCTSLDTFSGCLNNVARFLESEHKPTGILRCAPGDECRIGYIPTLIPTNINNKMQFVYHLQGTAAKLITVSLDKDFVGGVILDPNVVQPQVRLNKETMSLKVNQQGGITANIANCSEFDIAFGVRAYSKSGRAAISPSNINNFGPVPAGGGQCLYGLNQNFTVTGTMEGIDEICVEAISASQFGAGLSDEDCVTTTVTGQQASNCGNNSCEWWWPIFETEANCPEDCKEENGGLSDKEKCEQKEGDGFFISGYRWEETTAPWWGILFGQIGTTTRCAIEWNVLLILAIIGISAGIAIGIYFYRRR
jgi:hypothetical protein